MLHSYRVQLSKKESCHGILKSQRLPEHNEKANGTRYFLHHKSLKIMISLNISNKKTEESGKIIIAYYYDYFIIKSDFLGRQNIGMSVLGPFKFIQKTRT